MTTPTIHINGTSRDCLLEGWEAAFHALNVAYEALKQTAPHGRDYYPQGEAAIWAATEEHRSRLGRVQSVMQELEELMGSVV